ncbi:MAG: glycosyltransferase family 1 protein [Chloroflexota bacterium]|nr:MAG: glycosyltransferase family 1 protein [Chloroflexota bacterium]
MSNCLRVAMIIQSYYPRVGGAERQIASLAPLLQRDGVELQVLTRRYPGLSRFEMIGGVPVHRLPVPGPKPAAALVFTLAALPVLRRFSPHLVHAHELLSPASTALAARRMFGTPAVAKVLRSGSLGDLAKLRKRPMGARRIQALVTGLDAFITISREIEAELAAAGAPAEKLVFIPNGVDSRRFAPLAEPERQALRRSLGIDGGPAVLFTGRMSAEKRLDQLVRLWPQVRQAHPQATLLLVGEGEQRPELEQAGGKGVRLIPPVDDVAPYLQAADLFVLPSATEGLSNALLEAMAAGLAVVATSVGGASDVIEQGVSGRLVPPDRPDLLLEAINGLLAGPELRRRFGQAGRERMISEYSLPSVAGRLKELYERIYFGSDILA